MAYGSKAMNPAFAHVGQLLATYLEHERIKVGDFSERMGMHRSWNTPYSWLRGSNAPTGIYQERMAKLLGVTPEELEPRGDLSPAQRNARSANAMRVARITHTREQEVLALEQHLDAPPPVSNVVMLPPKPQDVLSYNVDSTGQAVIRMVARGSHKHMAALFGMLLNAGIVPNGEEEPADEG